MVRQVTRGIFPLDERWQLEGSGFSTELSKQIVWLSGQMRFADASKVLERLAPVSVAPTSVWQQPQQHGQGLPAALERQRNPVGLERTRWEPWR